LRRDARGDANGKTTVELNGVRLYTRRVGTMARPRGRPARRKPGATHDYCFPQYGPPRRRRGRVLLYYDQAGGGGRVTGPARRAVGWRGRQGFGLTSRPCRGPTGEARDRLTIARLFLGGDLRAMLYCDSSTLTGFARAGVVSSQHVTGQRGRGRISGASLRGPAGPAVDFARKPRRLMGVGLARTDLPKSTAAIAFRRLSSRRDFRG